MMLTTDVQNFEATIDELFHKHRQERFSLPEQPLTTRFRNALDRLTYKDEKEFLESPDVPIDVRLKLVQNLSRLWSRSGYNQAILKELETLIRGIAALHPARPLKILDIGIGGGGLLKEIHRWSKKNDIATELSGLDISEDFIRIIQSDFETQGIPVNLFAGDATNMGTIEDQTYDVVISSAMVHHIRSAGKVASFFREVFRISRHGWLIVDLDRRFWGPLFVTLSGLFFLEPLPLIHDGLKSARRAYQASEVNFLLDEIRKVQDLPNMTCRPHPFFPFWVVKGTRAFF